MKEIKAFVRPDEFDEIYSNLKSKGFCCMTVTECEGTGNYRDPDKLEYPDRKIPYMHSKVFKIEIISSDEDEKEIVDTIVSSGKTGHQGDGIIYVIDVGRAVSVRTGEEGEGIL
jgi:nitrogen regulatory protein P-II 1